jgi:hypothetical protein
VDTRFAKRRAEGIIDSVSGVEDVRNELQIRKATGSMAEDREASAVAPRKSGKQSQGQAAKMQ